MPVGKSGCARSRATLVRPPWESTTSEALEAQRLPPRQPDRIEARVFGEWSGLAESLFDSASEPLNSDSDRAGSEPVWTWRSRQRMALSRDPLGGRSSSVSYGSTSRSTENRPERTPPMSSPARRAFRERNR